MIMEGLASRSEIRKELERERRRLRDRQRRQSMSHEEREKHLARRRRNYQLRRQRAETARLYPRSPQVRFEETAVSAIHSPTITDSVSDSSSLFNAADASVVDRDHGHERLLLDTTRSHSLQIPAHKLASLPGRVRLNRVKHLARALNDRIRHGPATGGTMKENGISDCLVSKRLRLNQIKRIARGVSPVVQQTHSQSHQSIAEGNN